MVAAFSWIFLGQTGFSCAQEDIQNDAVSDVDPIIPPTVYQTTPFEQRSTTVNIGDVLGGKKGYIHPYLSVGEFFTDNLFETESNEKSDFITRLVPGIWAALPASREQLLKVSTLNTAPGGLELSRFRSASPSRLQAYGLYQGDFNFHSRFSSEDHVKQRGEGLVRYNFRGGLSLEIFDIYDVDYDAYSDDPGGELERFTSNLVRAAAIYEISPKITVSGEYGYYFLDYASDRRDFRDREDHSFTAQVLYNISPKTAVFVEYDFVDISYDEDILNDSELNQFFAGASWSVTSKSRFLAKLGYEIKDFDDSDVNSRDSFIYELQFDHRFTPKTSAQLRAIHQTRETDTVDNDFVVTDRVLLRYIQRFTTKLTGSLSFYYKRDSYHGDITVAGDSGKRKDDNFGAGLGLRYNIKRWLVFSGGYEFLKKDSNFDNFDFDKNSVYLNVVFIL
jgi:hypothetical protein